jgi:hypothetical protein
MIELITDHPIISSIFAILIIWIVCEFVNAPVIEDEE